MRLRASTRSKRERRRPELISWGACNRRSLSAVPALALPCVPQGTVLVADNVIYPGAPDFLQWVDTAQGRYETKLFEAVFEYEQVWNKDWTLKKKDAMSYSVRVAPV